MIPCSLLFYRFCVYLQFCFYYTNSSCWQLNSSTRISCKTFKSCTKLSARYQADPTTSHGLFQRPLSDLQEIASPYKTEVVPFPLHHPTMYLPRLLFVVIHHTKHRPTCCWSPSNTFDCSRTPKPGVGCSMLENCCFCSTKERLSCTALAWWFRAGTHGLHPLSEKCSNHRHFHYWWASHCTTGERLLKVCRCPSVQASSTAPWVWSQFFFFFFSDQFLDRSL